MYSYRGIYTQLATEKSNNGLCTLERRDSRVFLAGRTNEAVHPEADGLEGPWRVAGLSLHERLKKLESDVHRWWRQE
jgi:hypothetical protein